MPYTRTFIREHQKEIGVVFLLIAATLPTLLWMSDRWFAEDSYYGHGILVPFVSLFLIWRNKEDFKKITFEPSSWGLIVFVCGIVIYWISALARVYFSSGFSIIIIIAGLVLHFYGEKTFRLVLFPLLFLVFMIPMPLILVAYVCFKLKFIAAHLATFILNMIGLPALQQSSIIKMRHSYVLVEDSCGGLRSLISLTALGSIFAYQLKSNFLRKSLLFLSAIPIATISNSCRIVFLSAVGEIFGTQYSKGFWHELSGYSVFAFSFLLLYVLKNILEKNKII